MPGMLRTVLVAAATGAIVAGAAIAMPAAASAAEPTEAPFTPAALATPMDPPCTQPWLRGRADHAEDNGHDRRADRLDDRADNRADRLNCEHPG